MDQFAPFLPVVIAGFGSTLIPLFLVKKSHLVRLAAITTNPRDGWRPFAPNWITVWGFLFTSIGSVLYWNGFWAWGVGFVGFGAILDKFDGDSARAQRSSIPPPSEWGPSKKHAGKRVVHGKLRGQTHTFLIKDSWFSRAWFEMNFAGQTDLGKILDPATDKLKYSPILIGFGSLHLLLWPFIAAILVFDVSGTLMRRPFSLFAKYQRDSAASLIGKMKTTAIWIVLGLCVPFHEQWSSFAPLLSHTHVQLIALNVPLFLGVMLALASPFSRLYRR